MPCSINLKKKSHLFNRRTNMKSLLEQKPTLNGLGIYIFAACIAAGATAFTGCYHVEDCNELDSVEVNHALNGFGDCASFEAYAKLNKNISTTTSN